MGRKRLENAKTVVVRISKRVRSKLDKVKGDYGLPARYTENDIIEFILGPYIGGNGLEENQQISLE